MRSKLVIAILAVALGVLGAPSPAMAAAKSNVKIAGFEVKSPGNKTRVIFNGSVSSPKNKCERGRKVILRQIDQDKVAGTDRTNRQGKWTISFNGDRVGPGDFRAIVKKKPGCKADTSKKFAAG